MTKVRLAYLGSVLASATLCLAACSGGGGGGTVSGAATPAPAPPTTTSGVAINLQPANTTVSYQAAATNAAGQSPTVALTTDASGNLKAVLFNLPGFSGSLSSQSPSLSSPLTIDARQIAGLLRETVGFPNTIFYSLSQVAGSQTLSASAFGVWGTNTLLIAGDAGGFAFGNLTPPATVPATGSATFNGSVTGVGVANSNTAFGLQGNAQIIANFSNQSVTTNLTNFSTANGAGAATTATLPNLTGTSAISGNSYSGPIAGGEVTGTIAGNFYGGGASETAGIFQGSGGGNAFWGSYGAK